MSDQTPNGNSPPPLRTEPPTDSTPRTPPPPPPPPRPPVAKMASTNALPADRQPVVAQPVEPELVPSRRRPLMFALVAVLAVGGVVGGLLVGTGGGSSDETTIIEADLPAADDVTVTVAPATAEAAAVTTAVPATTQAPATTQVPATTQAPATTEAPAPTQPGTAFPTSPDGAPEPIVAIYDGATIRVSGWVPSQEKATQLEALALANSTEPTAQVDSTWSIDPSVPLNIGTRVIEMNSPRFPAGIADVTPDHAVQLDRVAGVLNLLPNVTATVVGHSDQLGDAMQNYMLSEARAVSVVRYLVSQGIDPSRLSARAVGEQDLLSEEESEASLALNRRTEFIFFGLLAD